MQRGVTLKETVLLTLLVHTGLDFASTTLDIADVKLCKAVLGYHRSLVGGILACNFAC